MGTVPAYSNTTTAAGVTNPAANAVLATVTVPPGVYAVAYASYYTGTPTSADVENIGLQSDPTTASSFVTAQTALTEPVTNATLVFFHYLVYALTTIRLIAVATTSSGAIYHAQLEAVNPGPSGAFL